MIISLSKDQIEKFKLLLDHELRINGINSLFMVTELFNVLNSAIEEEQIHEISKINEENIVKP